MRQLFSQILRFKNLYGQDYPDWHEKRIKDLFEERNEKGYESLELLSVTLKDGVILRNEIDSKDNSSENKSNYKRVAQDDIVYNSMRMWQGASGKSNYDGIVSPAYTVLSPKKGISSSFFAYYFKTPFAIYQFKKYSQGLTSDTWNLKYPLISQIKLIFPSLDEQNKINAFLTKFDEKIEKMKKELEKVKKFKKGLLQKMFC